MQNKPPRAIKTDEIETFHLDGVVLLKQMFTADWVDVLT